MNESGKDFNHEEALEIFKDLLPKIGKQILIMREEGRLDPIVKKSAIKEIVTKADLLSENLLTECVRKCWLHYGIRGEEGAEVRSSSEYEWLFDPIDATHRFAAGMDLFSISVGLLKNGIPEFGILYFPANNIFINASRGKGTFLNGEKVVVSSGGPIADELFVSVDSITQPEIAEKVRSLGCMILEIHSFTGSTLLLIQGKIGFYLHGGASPFDLGAAALIAGEAGCAVSQIDAGLIDFHQKKIPVILARSKEILDEIRQMV